MVTIDKKVIAPERLAPVMSACELLSLVGCYPETAMLVELRDGKLYRYRRNVEIGLDVDRNFYVDRAGFPFKKPW